MPFGADSRGVVGSDSGSEIMTPLSSTSEGFNNKVQKTLSLAAVGAVPLKETLVPSHDRDGA